MTETPARDTTSIRPVRLLPGEVPDGAGLWAVELARRGPRFDGWLGQIDWWTGGVLRNWRPELCRDGKADLFVGLDWLLSEGLLVLPGPPDSSDAACVAWAKSIVERARGLGVSELAIGLNRIGRGEGDMDRIVDLLGRELAAPGIEVRVWTGGLFDPLRDGYPAGSG